MRNLIMMMGLMAVTSACETPQQTTAAGAATGAIIGASVSNDDDKFKGAVIGGAAGLIAGKMIGQASTPGDCVYRDSYGRQYVAPCS